jgi:uncharacterized protein (DUF1684 family)
VARLTGERGWLSVVALHWLGPGENRPEGLPGTFTLRDGRIELGASAGDGYALDGAPMERRVLASGASAKPDLLSLGATRHVQLLERGGRFALRVWDSEAAALRDFRGIGTFPFDPAWIVEGRWEPFHPPRRVTVQDVVGTETPRSVPGRAAFAVGGRELSLEPTLDGDRLAFVFRDATAGKETYGAGRFLSAAAPREGRLVLDFNRAFNPPCAFTPFATCPLPRPENVLPVPVPAGERFDGGH